LLIKSVTAGHVPHGSWSNAVHEIAAIASWQYASTIMQV